MKYIYKITNTINGKVYVGKTKDPNKRFKRHKSLAKAGVGRCFYDAIREYGEESFVLEIIEECADDVSDLRESYWIKELNSTNENAGYNRTYGGDGGNTWALNPNKAAISKNLSTKLKGHRVNLSSIRTQADKRKGTRLSEETRRKISRTLIDGYKSGRIKSNPPPWYDRTGCKHPDAAKEKQSEYRKGKTYEEIYGEEKANSLKEKRRETWRDEKNPNYKSVDIDNVISCLRSGMSGKEVASKYGVTYATLRNKLKKQGLSITNIKGET